MSLKLNSKEMITKCGLVSIMVALIEKNAVSEEIAKELQFCIDQHNYKLENGQENGFDQQAIFDTLETLAGVFDIDLDYGF